MTRALDRIPGSIPDPFCLLDAVRAWDREEIEAERSFRASPAWQALEAAAQACALHQRALADFTRHAFLLSIQRFPLEPARLEGRYAIAGRVLGQSGQSALYRVRLAPLSADPSALQCCLEGQIAIGLASYGERFRQDRLEARFRERWRRLATQQASRDASQDAGQDASHGGCRLCPSLLP